MTLWCFLKYVDEGLLNSCVYKQFKLLFSHFAHCSFSFFNACLFAGGSCFLPLASCMFSPILPPGGSGQPSGRGGRVHWCVHVHVGRLMESKSHDQHECNGCVSAVCVFFCFFDMCYIVIWRTAISCIPSPPSPAPLQRYQNSTHVVCNGKAQGGDTWNVKAGRASES